MAGALELIQDAMAKVISGRCDRLGAGRCNQQPIETLFFIFAAIGAAWQLRGREFRSDFFRWRVASCLSISFVELALLICGEKELSDFCSSVLRPAGRALLIVYGLDMMHEGLNCTLKERHLGHLTRRPLLTFGCGMSGVFISTLPIWAGCCCRAHERERIE